MAGELQDYIVSMERLDAIKRMEQTVARYPEIADEEATEATGFWENVGDFWSAAGHAAAGPLRDLQIWQRGQAQKGARYIKGMRELSEQEPYGETGR